MKSVVRKGETLKNKKRKIIAIFIAYNAAKTLEKFYNNFPKHLVDDIILVDDASKDDTYKIAKKLGIKSYENPVNLGYGGNMKRILSIALAQGGDVFVDIHPDGEYKTSVIPAALELINSGSLFVLGNRFTSMDKPLKSGMRVWKWLPIRLLNLIDNWVLGIQINDLHQGFRVYTREMLSKINFEENSNGYIFSFELIAQSVFAKIKITQIPVETNYTGKKRGASLKHSIIYTIGTFKTLLSFILARLGFANKMFQRPKGSLKTRLSEI